MLKRNIVLFSVRNYWIFNFIKSKSFEVNVLNVRKFVYKYHKLFICGNDLKLFIYLMFNLNKIVLSYSLQAIH